MPRAIVTLAEQSQFPRPSIGNFLWSHEHSRHVWNGTEATTFAEIATQVEEAFDFIRLQNNPYMTLRVVVVDDVPAEAPAAPAKLKLKKPHENGH